MRADRAQRLGEPPIPWLVQIWWRLPMKGLPGFASGYSLTLAEASMLLYFAFQKRKKRILARLAKAQDWSRRRRRSSREWLISRGKTGGACHNLLIIETTRNIPIVGLVQWIDNVEIC